MQETIQILCHLPQGEVATISSKYINTVWLSTFQILQKVHLLFQKRKY